MAAGILAIAHVTPYWLFTDRVVFSFCTPVSSAWLALITAGGTRSLTVPLTRGRVLLCQTVTS